MLPDSHLYNTEKPSVKKLQNKLKTRAIHYRQSKYFLIVSVHVSEVLHRSDFYRKKKTNPNHLRTPSYFFSVYDTLMCYDLAALSILRLWFL